MNLSPLGIRYFITISCHIKKKVHKNFTKTSLINTSIKIDSLKGASWGARSLISKTKRRTSMSSNGILFWTIGLFSLWTKLQRKWETQEIIAKWREFTTNISKGIAKYQLIRRFISNKSRTLWNNRLFILWVNTAKRRKNSSRKLLLSNWRTRRKRRSFLFCINRNNQVKFSHKQK